MSDIHKIIHTLEKPPGPTPDAGRQALKVLLSTRSILDTLEAFHKEMGDVFRISLPGFAPVFLVGPEANRFVLITDREGLSWRPESDPVTQLLRRGLLIVDGEFHDHLRKAMMPAVQKRKLPDYVSAIRRRTDQVLGEWHDGQTVDLLVEMRRAALLILLDALYDVDFTPDLDRLWPDILRLLKYISPGAWVLAPWLPRPGYGGAIRRMDEYLYRLIRSRRENPTGGNDLLSLLIVQPDMDDDLIRDQLLTMLIAGHDTSTALLAWTLLLLGQHPEEMKRVQKEVRGVLGQSLPDEENVDRMERLDQVIKETLRLYPPIHLGMRIAKRDLEFQGYQIPAGTRVTYSIYLTHRHPDYWEEPGLFNPDRFAEDAGKKPAAYTYLPFGGGPRNCIGMPFAQLEVKIVLARLLHQFTLTLEPGEVHAHMGATLEPYPGVRMRVSRQ